MIIKGLYTALITPFTNDSEDIAWDVFDTLLQRQIDAQVSGIVLFGTTGESATLTSSERTALLQRAIKAAKGKTQILAGCGTNSTKSTIEQAIDAEALGADCIQLVSPSYNKPTQDGLLAHIKAVHDAVRIPICLYNIPGRTAVNIEPKTLLQLAELERVIGIKEASGSIQQLMDITEHNPKVSILTGDDLLLIPSVSVGALGVTSVISNLIPQTMQKLVTLCLEGDFVAARKLFFTIKPLIQGCFLETNPAPIKLLLQMCGYQTGPCRLPLAPLQAKTQQSIQEILESIDNPECIQS